MPCLDGVYAASLTPQHADLRIDIDAWTDHIRRLLAHGCTGVLLFGSTGEANSFSVRERQEGLAAVLDAGIPPERLMVGAGCCALPDTVALIRHALDHGVPGVLVMPPFYYRDVSEDGTFAALEHIVTQVDDDRLAIYLYHFPKMSGVPYTPALIERLCDAFPDTIAGVKDSSSNWAHMRLLCALFPDLQIFGGTEAFLLDLLEEGGAGCISATANVTGPLAGQIAEQWQQRDMRAAQARLTQLRTVLANAPVIPGLKHAMAAITDRPDWLHMRPPLTPLDADARNALQTALADLEIPLATI